MNNAIEIKGLVKDFPVGLRGVRLRAVDHIDLTVRANEVFGLLGPNGCGKSTTLKIALGLLEPTAGQCRVFGQPAGDLSARRLVGFLPESPYFYRYLSGRELLRYYARLSGLAAREYHGRITAVLEQVGLTEAADRRVGTYSKGMLQRIGMAQALVHDPQLLILDEPTAGVDPVGAIQITQIIRQLKEEGRTVVLCSHLLAQVEEVCDRVAIMDHGRVLVGGDVETLLTRRESGLVEVSPWDATQRAALEAWAQEKGVKAIPRGHPRLTLDELYLQAMEESRQTRTSA